MTTIAFFTTHERPGARVGSGGTYLPGPDTVRGTERAVIHLDVNQDVLVHRDSRVQAVARFLASHLTSTMIQTSGKDSLRLVGVNRQTPEDQQIFGVLDPRIDWRFPMMTFHQDAAAYLLQEAQKIVRLHDKEGLQYAELQGHRLMFNRMSSGSS